MAWNEPGNNNNDPWKNRGGKDQGPPDLDDIFKNVFAKFNKFGGKGSNNSGGGKGISGMGFGLIAGILIAVWVISGFYTIREAERGIVLRFGEYSHLVEPGLRWKPTFVDTVVPVNVQQIRDMPSEGSMITKDENLVSVKMEVQYRVIDPYKFTFAVTNPERSISQAFDSAIRYVVGHSSMDAVLTSGREEVRQQVRQELTEILEPYDMGIAIVDMNLNDARPPTQVKAAFDDAIAAQEDEERFIREAEAYAKEIEPRARGQVNRMAEEAKAYKERVILEAQGEVARFAKLLPEFEAAPQVTRQRIYLETLEEVFGNTSKILVNDKDGGNMMYLPLDKILQQNSPRASSSVRRNTIDGLRNAERSNPTSNSSPSTLRGDRFRSGRN